MAEKPILFNGRMVRAILSGVKTQTRRVIKPQPGPHLGYMIGRSGQYAIQCGEDYPDDASDRVVCRYPVGTRLWVRETWATRSDLPGAVYRADYQGPADRPFEHIHDDETRWRVSIHMPRRHARIFLDVTNVRVQRLREISEDDAIAEGVSPGFDDPARRKFAELWDSINGKRGHGWAENRWVWVYTFERAVKEASL